ncbi:endonuclease [Marinobacter salicampi]|uniref:endonuclease n=1 Tax=Marinobacter salicampi TaxID=435907 RepID=UPI001F5E8621|nr:endonuclease [Marinobacter salicampi]
MFCRSRAAMRLTTRFVLLIILGFTLSSAASAEITSFRFAKELLRSYVYFDRTEGDKGTFYCGCNWRWQGASGGVPDLSSCNYTTRAQEHRSSRTEWEHVVPAWVVGHQRQCWQKGGRSNCRASDPVFGRMEADPHNLVPTIGETNADRSNYGFGMIDGEPRVYGQCDFEVDFKARVAEPRPEVRGQIARIYFYMHDRYGLRMSRQDQQLYLAWDRQHPVSAWELERDRRIARIAGNHNPFVTGEQSWSLGHRPSASGLNSAPGQKAQQQRQHPNNEVAIRGNKNSKVYHLPSGCPSYGRISAHNIVPFGSEEAAVQAGFRKAGNCR